MQRTPNISSLVQISVLALALATTARGEDRLLASRPAQGAAFVIAELGLEMRPVPAGSFRMGSPAGEPGHTAGEGPQTTVTLTQPLWLGRTPVTHAQWFKIMGTDLVAQAQKAVPANPDIAGFVVGVGDDVAMHLVTWDEAMEFCAKLTERARAEGTLPAGYEFALPTEAQWEYACRAGTTAATYADTSLDAIAWYAENSSVGYIGPAWDSGPGGPAGPRRVGLKAPNAWGFCDLLGNVYQWCRDYAAATLPGGSVTDPTGPVSGADRVVRGGSWHSPAAFCRAGYRAWSSPEGRSQYIGFRVALAPTVKR